MTRSRCAQACSALLLVALAAGCSDGTGDPARPGADHVAPTVVSSLPIPDATDVATNSNVSATFSEAMDPTTVTAATFTLAKGSSSVSGTVSAEGLAATLHPDVELLPGALYVATISTAAEDEAGNALAAAYTWSFTTGFTADTTPPSVTSTDPIDGAEDIALAAAVTVTFSEAMDPVTLTATTFTLMDGATAIAGDVTFTGVTATFSPSVELSADTLYTVSITTGARDVAGNGLAAQVDWSFTTLTELDMEPPTVRLVHPEDAATDVLINRSVTATFSEAVNPASLEGNFTLEAPDASAVAGAVTTVGNQATFAPLEELAPDTAYKATLTTGVEDLAGNALAVGFSWTFTTGTRSARGPDAVLLGRAGDFAILSKSGIDSVPASVITGDIGVSPIDQTAITGFSLTADATNVFSTSDQITGQVFAADFASPTPSNLTTAVSDMQTAYTDAAGRPTPDETELGSGEIGGLTLAPGLYKWGTGVSISTDVTLDGGADDVWIFQIAGDITQASGTRVNLTGGALPQHVFWQTFGQLMIGTTAHFEGIALCQTAIVLRTGASVNGRLLAQTAVTLDQSTVTQPAE